MVYNLQKPPADLQSQTVALLKGEKIDYVLPTFTFLPLNKARFLLCAVSPLFFFILLSIFRWKITLTKSFSWNMENSTFNIYSLLLFKRGMVAGRIWNTFYRQKKKPIYSAVEDQANHTSLNLKRPLQCPTKARMIYW